MNWTLLSSDAGCSVYSCKSFWSDHVTFMIMKQFLPGKIFLLSLS